MSKLIEDHIYLASILASMLISFWLIANDDIIYRDAVLYLTVARNFLDGGLISAFGTFPWPFYGISIAIVHKITSLNLEHSAYLLTIVFEAIICVTFVKLYICISPEKSRPWVALLFILTFPILNEYRGEILRGYGFWAFTLMATYHFILYFQHGRLRNAIAWQALITVAALFRPEAIVIAAAGPLYFLFLFKRPLPDRLKQTLQLQFIFLLLAASFLLTMILSSRVRDMVFSNLPMQFEYMSITLVLANFNVATQNLIDHVLPFEYSERYSTLILGSGLLIMLLFKIIKNIGLVYSAVWLVGLRRKWTQIKPEYYIILYFSLISLSILVVFVSSRLFISSRYTVMLLLFLGLAFTQYFDAFLRILQESNRKYLPALLYIFIGALFLDSMVSTSAGKTPIKLAAQYSISVINPGDKTACNDNRFFFYSDFSCSFHPDLDKELENEASRKKIEDDFQYLLLWVKNKDQTLQNTLNNNRKLLLIKEFSNRDNDKGLLYKIQNP